LRSKFTSFDSSGDGVSILEGPRSGPEAAGRVRPGKMRIERIVDADAEIPPVEELVSLES